MTIPSAEQHFWYGNSAALLDQLGITERGLSSSEAASRLALTQRLAGHRRSAFKLLFDQFKSPITILLFCAAVLTFSLAIYDASTAGERFSISDAPDGGIIVFILLASGLLGFWQEKSAADVVAKLIGLIETKSTVVRDDEQVKVAIPNVVPGDIVCLSAGEVIPGDCRLLSSQELLVNEAALTGESFPVEKFPAEFPVETPLAERINFLYLGTHVVSGYGQAVVAITGRQTELGKISVRLEHKAPETGFERGIRFFGQLLIKVVVLITVIAYCISPISTLVCKQAI